jgi:alanyl-tRNA synthetase
VSRRACGESRRLPGRARSIRSGGAKASRSDIGGQLGARDGAALERLEKLLAREKELEKKLRALEQKLVSPVRPPAAPTEQVREANGVKIVTRRVEGVEAKSLREMADRMRQKHGSAVVAIGSDLGDNKAALLVAVTADLAGGSRPATSSSKLRRLSAAPAADVGLRAGRRSRRGQARRGPGGIAALV